MFAYTNSPFGVIDFYNLFITVGTVLGLVVQVILLIKILKKKSYILYLIAYYLLMLLGRYAAIYVRVINNGLLEGKVSISGASGLLGGTHFLGYVYVFAFLLIPAFWFFSGISKEVFGYIICDKKEMISIAEIVTIALPIQHFFNRIACFMRGCCYGIAYDGPLSLSLPYNRNLDHRVFPSQLLEALFMLVLVIVIFVLIRKNKHFYGQLLIGFGVTFFITEFFFENENSVKHLNLTYNQFLGLALVVIGVLYVVFLGRAGATLKPENDNE